jgi:NADPH:quinone reductase
MQAIIFEEAGEPTEVLRFTEVASPAIGLDMALIRVAARPIHPADLAFIRGQYRLRPSFPQVAGLEGCGEIVEGPARSQFRPGTRVAFRYPGSWAQFAAVPLDRLVTVPADITDTDASQASLNPVTAWALLEQAGTRPGDWIVLTAATSVVANLIAQMARLRGINTVGVVRGNASTDKARSAADYLVSAQEADLSAAIARTAGKVRFAALIDSVGGSLVANLMTVLAPGATIIAYGVQNREPAAVTNAMLIYSNLTWKGFGIDRWLSLQSNETKTTMFSEIWTMIRAGEIRLPVDSTHTLSDIAQALSADARIGRIGKVILTG